MRTVDGVRGDGRGWVKGSGTGTGLEGGGVGLLSSPSLDGLGAGGLGVPGRALEGGEGGLGGLRILEMWIEMSLKRRMKMSRRLWRRLKCQSPTARAVKRPALMKVSAVGVQSKESQHAKVATRAMRKTRVHSMAGGC